MGTLAVFLGFASLVTAVVAIVQAARKSRSWRYWLAGCAGCFIVFFIVTTALPEAPTGPRDTSPASAESRLPTPARQPSRVEPVQPAAPEPSSTTPNDREHVAVEPVNVPERADDKDAISDRVRKEIFRELVAAEERAIAQADKLYPVNIKDPAYEKGNPQKNFDKTEELTEQYRAEIRAKYGITEETEWEIADEGLKKDWLLETR